MALDRAQALRNLAAAMGRSNLPKATLDIIVEKSLPWSDPMFEKAIESIANDPDRKQYFPTWAEILERLPSLGGAGDRGPNPFHWHSDGSWGGDPSRPRTVYLLLVLGTMFGNAIERDPPYLIRQRDELRKYAQGKRGIPSAAIEAAASSWRNTNAIDEEWLAEMLAGEAPHKWPRSA